MKGEDLQKAGTLYQEAESLVEFLRGLVQYTSPVKARFDHEENHLTLSLSRVSVKEVVTKQLKVAIMQLSILGVFIPEEWEELLQ
jgi:hypothetical protein